MRAMNWRSMTAAVGLLAGAAALLDNGPAFPADQRWGADYFPNVVLTTQDGKTVRLYEDLLKGKSVAINVIFTECTDVCPLETATLARCGATSVGGAERAFSFTRSASIRRAI